MASDDDDDDDDSNNSIIIKIIRLKGAISQSVYSDKHTQAFIKV